MCVYICIMYGAMCPNLGYGGLTRPHPQMVAHVQDNSKLSAFQINLFSIRTCKCDGALKPGSSTSVKGHGCLRSQF